MTARVLAVIDRRADGTREQIADLIEFCVGVRTGFGSLDLVLRGHSVVCATEGRRPPEQADPLEGSRRRLSTLLRIGVRTWVDSTDLAEHAPGSPLLQGAVEIDTDTLAGTWSTYENVWFL